MWVADGSWAFQVVSLPRVEHTADAMIDSLMQVNDDCHLVHTIQGRALLHTPRGVFESHPGVVLAVPVLETNRWEKQAGQRWRMLNFHIRIHDGQGRAMHERELLPVSFTPENLPRIHRQLAQCHALWHAGDWREQAQAAGQIIALTGSYLHDHGLADADDIAPDELMLRARQQLDRQANKPFDGPDIAAAHGLSVSQFNRRFKAAMGMAPKAYVMRQRLALAQSLLLESALPVHRIAHTLGFGDVYHFSKWFSRQSGQPPRQYRQQGRRL